MKDSPDKIKCPNCEKEFDSNFNYCPYCGQKNIDPDPKLKHFLSEFLSANFNLDSKIFITLKALLLKPAELSKAFLAGKREKYLTPVRLYFVVSLVYFFLLSINLDKDAGIVEINETNTELNDSTNNLSIFIDEVNPDTLSSMEKKVYHNIKLLKTPTGQQMFKQILKKNISLGMFAFIPLTALILFMLFRKKTVYYIPNLIFAIHLQSLIFLWFSFLILIGFILDFTILKVVGLLFLAYIIFRWIKAFYETSLAKTIWKMFLFFTLWLSMLVVFFIVAFGSSIWLLS